MPDACPCRSGTSPPPPSLRKTIKARPFSGFSTTAAACVLLSVTDPERGSVEHRFFLWSSVIPMAASVG